MLFDAPGGSEMRHLLPEQHVLSLGLEPVPDGGGVPGGQGRKAGAEDVLVFFHVDYSFPVFVLRLPILYDLPFVVRMWA